jgi:simple sugar transport system substrate-binding protein
LEGGNRHTDVIDAIHSFIAEDVDVIALNPLISLDMFEIALKETKEAGIPIIILECPYPTEGFEEYYVSHLANDHIEEGRQAGQVLVELMDGQANIVELTGTTGSPIADERSQGFREALRGHPEMKILASKPGDFMRFFGKDVMVEFLEEYGEEIDALYSHNEVMTMGAIEAIEEYGLRPGVDIKIISIMDYDDYPREVFEILQAGKINAIIECSPEYGPLFFDLALKVAKGEEVPKKVYVEGGIFFPEDAEQFLPTPAPKP